MLAVVPTVGENVKRLRVAAGISTQSKLAELMDVPQPRVSDLENDRWTLPDTRTLIQAASAIGCLVDDLLAGVDPDYDAKKRSGPSAPRPVKATAAVTKVVRLLEQMSDEGQRLAARNVALLLPAFRRELPPQSGAPRNQKRAARAK